MLIWSWKYKQFIQCHFLIHNAMMGLLSVIRSKIWNSMGCKRIGIDALNLGGSENTHNLDLFKVF